MFAYYMALATRSLRRTPWLSFLMIATLAIGLVASTTTLTLRYALASDPIPNKSQRLLTFEDGGDTFHGSRFSYAQAASLASVSNRSLIMGQGIATLRRPDHIGALLTSYPVRYTTPNFFRFFDVPLADGRIWSAGEEARASPVIVLSSAAARHLFGRTHVVGQNVTIGDTAYRIVGVVGRWHPVPRYYDMSVGVFAPPDVAYLPLTAITYGPADLGVPMSCPASDAMPAVSRLLRSPCQWLAVWYLAGDTNAAGVVVGRARAALPHVLAKRRASHTRVVNVKQLMATADVVPGSVRLYANLGIAFLVLAIINVGGMQLSRLLRRTSTTGIRRALGASRMDIITQYLCETLVIGVCGGVLGVAITQVSLYGIRQLPLLYAQAAHMGETMAIATLLIILLCCVLIGIVPAWAASRANPASVIKVE